VSVAAEAVGMVEVKGLSTAVVAVNVATQTAAVTVGGLGYLHEGQVMLTVRGSVDSVRAALDAITARLAPAGIRASSVIARPDTQVEDVISERFVPVGGRVGAPRVPGRGRRYSQAPAPEPSATPGTDEQDAGAGGGDRDAAGGTLSNDGNER
jgi:hypothetical protein